MAIPFSEYELEALPEFEAHEAAIDGEGESEQFFGALASLAGRGAGWATQAGSPQRRFALWAARQALSKGLPAVAKWAGSQIGGSRNGATGAQWGRRAASWLSHQLPQQEYMAEFEWEADGELNPVRKWYPDAMLEHIGHAMAEAESPAQADALAGALVPLAAQATPQAAPVLIMALPGLVSGLSGIVHGMQARPSTKPLVRVVPGIVRRTAKSLANQASQAGAISPQDAVRTLARQTYQVLSRPQIAARTFRQSQAIDRKFHKASGVSRPCCASCAAKGTCAGKGK